MWPFKSKSKTKMFKNVDLNVYNFLGSATVTYNDTQGVVYKSLNLLYFSNKNNDKDRILIKDDPTLNKYDSFHRHPYVKDSEIWAIGEGNLYTYIDKPSDFLKDWMDRTYGYAWNGKNWTRATDEASIKPLPKITSKDNIVEIDFSRKTDDN